MDLRSVPYKAVLTSFSHTYHDSQNLNRHCSHDSPPLQLSVVSLSASNFFSLQVSPLSAVALFSSLQIQPNSSSQVWLSSLLLLSRFSPPSRSCRSPIWLSHLFSLKLPPISLLRLSNSSPSVTLRSSPNSDRHVIFSSAIESTKMAPSAIFLSSARRLLMSRNPNLQYTIPLSYFSSGPPTRAPAPVTPVSYPIKHQDSADEEPGKPQPLKSDPSPQILRESGQRSLTREEARYVRETPGVSSVSYPTRVAPLPEFKAEEQKEEDDRNVGEELKAEAEKIKAYTGVLKNLEGHEVEKVPFPRLIKPEKRQPNAVVDLQKAIKEVKANAKRNFLETVEAHVRLGVNPRRSDQTVRGAVTLPHGTGKDVRVAVFAEGAQADEARAAGADIVGGDELIEEIRKGGGKLNFDKCIATPSFMPRLGKIARILGPRGLMPNPKLGSVTSNVSGAVKEAKCGRVDFKMDKTAIVHVGLGKANFSEDALRENIGAFVNALLHVKPAGLKKTSRYAGYVNGFSLSSTMGPGFPVSIQSLSEAADNYNKLHPKTAA